jgi:hypothetical protein
MLYIVDGSGPLFETEYAVQMAGSHCAVLHHLNKPNAHYFRGPSTLSALKTTSGAADAVLQTLMAHEFPPTIEAPGQRLAPRSKIFLAGHSRGGAAVVRVAQILAAQDIEVEAMFLFDAVDRTVFLPDVQTVPGNVRNCFHALRNEGAEVVLAHETAALWTKLQQSPGFNELRDEYRRSGSGPFETFLARRSASMSSRYPALNMAVRAWSAKQQTYAGMKAAMRNSFTVEGAPSIPFGNCAVAADPKCRYIAQSFACSHGAVGGVPWTELGPEVAAIDRDGARRVMAWMASNVQGHRLRFGARGG